MDGYDEVDYSPHEEDTFNAWVELGALDRDQQRFLDYDPIRRFIIKVKSSSDEAEALIHEPLGFLLAAEIPGVTPSSRITSVFNHHERGYRYRIIRAIAKVDQGTGDVTLDFDKEV
jgi:hypothetical protein